MKLFTSRLNWVLEIPLSPLLWSEVVWVMSAWKLVSKTLDFEVSIVGSPWCNLSHNTPRISLWLIEKPLGKNQNPTQIICRWQMLKGWGQFITVTSNIRMEESKILNRSSKQNDFICVDQYFSWRVKTDIVSTLKNLQDLPTNHMVCFILITFYLFKFNSRKAKSFLENYLIILPTQLLR
jgi:hypothetical protein